MDDVVGVDSIAVNAGIVSGEDVEQVDVEMDSGDNEFVVVDQENNVVVMEATSKQSTVEVLKTLESEQVDNSPAYTNVAENPTTDYAPDTNVGETLMLTLLLLQIL